MFMRARSGSHARSSSRAGSRTDKLSLHSSSDLKLKTENTKLFSSSRLLNSVACGFSSDLIALCRNASSGYCLRPDRSSTISELFFFRAYPKSPAFTGWSTAQDELFTSAIRAICDIEFSVTKMPARKVSRAKQFVWSTRSVESSGKNVNQPAMPVYGKTNCCGPTVRNSIP